MQKHGFEMQRVFFSAPGDMEAEREACTKAMAEVNESDAMSHKILLNTVMVREDGHIETARAAISDNVRWASYFVQVFSDDWGPRNLFRKLFQLAIECRDDASKPMKDVVVFLKVPADEGDPAIVAFRKELRETAGVTVREYSGADELHAQLCPVLSGWVQVIRAELAGQLTE